MAKTPGKKAAAGTTGAAKTKGTGSSKPKKAPKAAPTPTDKAASAGEVDETPVLVGATVQGEAVIATPAEPASAAQPTEPIVAEPVTVPEPTNAPAPAVQSVQGTWAAGQPVPVPAEVDPPTYRPAPAPWALIVGLGGLVWATLLGLFVFGVARPGIVTFNPAWLLVGLGAVIVGFGVAGLVSSQRRRA